MLKVAKVRRGREAYYLASLPEEERQAGLVEEPGNWLGDAALRLGLEGEAVAAESLRALFEGIDPLRQVPLDARHGRVEIVAFDLTFTCPKSVSLLERLAPPDLAAQAVAAHSRAVASTLAYLEREATFVRRSRDGERRNEPGNGLIAAAFVHRASRAPDPHLHTHLLVANLGQDPGGRWSALDSRLLYAQLSTAGALYQAELRFRLSVELGVCWRTVGPHRYELAGVPERLSRAFSRRSAEIAEELAARGFASPRAARIAAATTRAPKDRGVPLEALGTSWRERALDLGLADSRWARVAPRRGVLGTSRAGGVLEGLERPFDRRSLLEVAARKATDGAPIAELESNIDRILGDRQLVKELPATSARLTRQGSRFPAGPPLARYTTEAIEHLQARLGAVLEAAVGLGQARTADGFPHSGVVLVEEPFGRERRAAMATAFADAAVVSRQSGRSLRLLAVDEEVAGRLEASIAGRCTRLAYPLAPRRGGITVVAGAERLAGTTLCSLAESALAGGGTLVLVLGAPPSGTIAGDRSPFRDAARRLQTAAPGRTVEPPRSRPDPATVLDPHRLRRQPQLPSVADRGLSLGR